MKLIPILTAVFLLGCGPNLIPCYAQADASEILKRLDRTIFGIKDKTQIMKMIIHNLDNDKKRIKEAVLYQKGTDQKLFRYLAPDSDVGIATLSTPEGDIYVYLPMFKNPKKITNLAESQTFNKSDFSIEDMATKAYSEKFDPELISEVGQTYVLNLTPLAEDPTYRRLEMHINKENYYLERIDYFDTNNELYKQALYEQTRLNGNWVPNQISMQDFQRNSKTTLYISDIKINTGLADDLFALENLPSE